MQKQTLIWLATLALLIAGMKGGLAPLGVKIALQELPPFTLLFLRITIMLLILLPITFSAFPLLKQQWKRALVLGSLWAANVTLFVIGIQFTTTISSQLLYAGVPFLVIIGNVFINRERLRITQLIGILLGFSGAILIIFKPDHITTGIGSFWGNLILFVATMCWAGYLLLSKKYSTGFTPQALTASSALVGWLVSGVLMLIFEGTSVISHPFSFSPSTWTALIFLGVFASVLMTYLYQFGLRHGSAITAATMMYVAPLIAVITGPIFLDEQITSQMIVGGGLLCVGLFFSSIFPLFKTRVY